LTRRAPYRAPSFPRGRSRISRARPPRAAGGLRSKWAPCARLRSKWAPCARLRSKLRKRAYRPPRQPTRSPATVASDGVGAGVKIAIFIARGWPARAMWGWGENSHFHRAGVARQGHVGLLGKEGGGRVYSGHEASPCHRGKSPAGGADRQRQCHGPRSITSSRWPRGARHRPAGGGRAPDPRRGQAQMR